MTDLMSGEEKIQPKVIAIYEGFIALREEGKSLSDIKVSDIAAKAGIGKGTVYEYFSSKEEIIMKSIVYEYYKGIHELSCLVDSKHKFVDRLDAALEWMGKNGPKAILTMQQIKQNKEMNERHPKLCNQLLGEGIFESLDEIADKILEAGVEEKIIREPQNSMERDMVLSAVAAAFMSYFSKAASFQNHTMEEAKQISKQILLTYFKN